MRFLVLFGLILLTFGYALVRARIKARRLSQVSWEGLLARLEPVQRGGIAAVARDYLQPSKGQLKLETDELWEMVGGMEGLRRMRDNAEVLLALAGYAQRWNPQESVVVLERMRRDGLALRRASNRLSLSLLLGYGKVRGPFNLHEAASAYYLMSERLLALYETSHAGRYPSLAAAV